MQKGMLKLVVSSEVLSESRRRLAVLLVPRVRLRIAHPLVLAADEPLGRHHLEPAASTVTALKAFSRRLPSNQSWCPFPLSALTASESTALSNRLSDRVMLRCYDVDMSD